MTSIAQATSDMIVVIHGFGGKRLVMEVLRRRLQRSGFVVTSWHYPSLLSSIDQHGAKLYEHLTHTLSQERRIHVVAHSLGAIVTRAALAMGPISNLSRAVFFAPPNHGSPIARHAAKLIGRVCKPISELSDADDSVVNRLPAIAWLDLGIVAARFDALIPVASTHLPDEREHVVLNATHNSLLLSKLAAKLATSFIVDGRFKLSDNHAVNGSRR